MKTIFLTLIVLTLGGCATIDKGANCLHLDKETGFAICETQAGACFLSNGGQTCYLKPPAAPATPAAAPSPAPAAAPAAVKK